MKVTSGPAVSSVPAPESRCRSLSLDSHWVSATCLPRAAMALGHDLGFSVASQRLARRRLAAIAQEGNGSDSLEFNCHECRSAEHPMAGSWQKHRLKVLPQYPRKIDQYRILAEADWERSQLTSRDQFEPHDVDHHLLGDLCQQLRLYPIAHAALVKKTLRFFPEQPLYVLLISPAAPWAEQPVSPLGSTLGTQIAQELCFSRELLVCLVGETEPPLVERIRAKCPGNLLTAMESL